MSAPVSDDLELLDARAVLEYVVERFHPRLAVACSFQKEASVILDMVFEIEPTTRVFTLDTGVLFPETHATWRALEQRYGITVEAYRGLSLERQAAQHGEALWARDPDACCALRKVTPLREALSDVDAWISGVRRDQAPSRAHSRKLGWDAAHGKWKASPLADWSDADVWRYLLERDIPYHPLHDRGYASIGCVPCTHQGAGRDGRWVGRAKTECGLHG